LAEDQLIRDVKASAAQIAPALVDQEIEAQIERQSGGMVSLSGNEHTAKLHQRILARLSPSPWQKIN